MTVLVFVTICLYIDIYLYIYMTSELFHISRSLLVPSAGHLNMNKTMNFELLMIEHLQAAS